MRLFVEHHQIEVLWDGSRLWTVSNRRQFAFLKLYFELDGSSRLRTRMGELLVILECGFGVMRLPAAHEPAVAGVNVFVGP